MSDFNFLIPMDYEDDPDHWDRMKHLSITSTGDAMDAAVDRAWYYNPMQSVRRMWEFDDARSETSRFLTEDEYKESEYARPGVFFDDGVKESVAAITAKRFDERAQFNDVINRAPDGFWTQAGIIGTEFAVSMADPFNLATALIPGLGLGLRAGSFGAAAARGATAGVIGAAAVEPLIYTAARQEQDNDYTALDSLMNMTVGGVLGGSFGVAGKKFSDWRASRAKTDPEARQLNPLDFRESITPDTHIGAFRTALAQIASDRAVDVSTVLELDPISGAHARSGATGNPKRFVPIDAEFETEIGAKRALTALRGNGIKLGGSGTVRVSGDRAVRIQQTPGGKWTIQVETASQPVTNTNGKIRAFTTEEQAVKFVRESGERGLRHVEMGDGLWMVLRNSTPDDARVQVDLNRTVRAKANLDEPVDVAYERIVQEAGGEPVLSQTGSPKHVLGPDEIRERARANHASRVGPGAMDDDPVELHSVDNSMDELVKQVEQVDADLAAIERSNPEFLDEIRDEMTEVDLELKRLDDFEQAASIAIACGIGKQI
ncbi:hypothetical protein V5T82_07295 [Magnetovibrio sp. PR-2]|uniref:hypothetical protein n=1 Tax=Magnetovibrio sp. PR-2 TaxID=3120356 RepID=UPI002FCE5A8F